MPSRTATGLDRRITVGTDVAGFYIFHPADLQHRLTSPLGWTLDDFACRAEFEAGRLVAFDTGSDGRYSIRVTDGPLTDREKKWFARSCDFRLVVRHGRVYLDGGDALPSDECCDESEERPAQWFDLPNGDYRVTVNAIEWYSEPGALDENDRATEGALAAYVVQFAPVDDLEAIAVFSTPPRLETSRDSSVEPDDELDALDSLDEEIKIPKRCVVLVNGDVAPVPGYEFELRAAYEVYEALYGREGSERSVVEIDGLAIAATDKTPCVGVLVTCGGGRRSPDGSFSLRFFAERLVTVRTLKPIRPWATAKVEPFERPQSVVPPKQSTALKRAFATYAKSNASYRAAIPNPDFEAERVASLTSPAALTDVLIHHLQMPVPTRLELLPLSDAERVARLIEIFAG